MRTLESFRTAVNEHFDGFLEESDRGTVLSFADLSADQMAKAAELFDFSSVYSMMYLKYLLADPQSEHVGEFVFDTFGGRRR